MKKLFLLIPALVLSLVINAAVINIAPGTSLAYTINDAQAGDVIVMADGLYPGEDQLHLTKDITIKAAEGAKPVVQTTYYSDLKSGAKVYIDGITFDGSNTTQQCIRVYDATAGKELHLNNCEFKNYPKDVISGDKAEYTLDSCVVTNCYFHNNNYSPIYFNKSSVEGQQTIYGLIVKNSTFSNNDPSKEYRATIDVQSYNREATDDIEVLVDHCTFYNNTTINYDYSAVRTRIVNKTTVSNCIFAHPSLIEFYATNVWAGNVTNCLAYNLNKGYMSGPTRTNTNTGDPLFTDAANSDFTFAGNWVTMELSPARGAATDGSDLGDPRWYSAEVLPSVDFASPYQFVGAKALLAGNIWYDSENGYIYGDGDHNENYGTATWKFHAEKACVAKISLNLNSESPSVHELRIDVLDADGNNIGEYAEQASTLPGTLTIPAAGDYKIILHDDKEWSSAKIDNITLAYIGGDVQAMPGTTDIDDAWFSANGTRADGKISFPGSTIQEGWVKWNVSFANTGNYNVTLNVNSNNCKNYTVALVDANDANVVTPLPLNDCSTKGTPVALAMGAMEVPAGNYILKVTNATQNSDAELISVQFAYTGGGIIDIPGSIALNEAILSERAFIDGDGLHFVDAEHLWLMSEGYAKWNIHVAADGMYKFTANCNTYETSYSNLTIKVLQGGEEKYTYTPQYTYTGEKAINSPEWFLEAGDYELKLSNPANHSNGYLVSLSAAAVEGILIVDEMATDMAYINELNGQSRKPLLKRSFKGGMYNTVLFPFNNVSDAELAEIFGEGYELIELTSATMDGNTLNLVFGNVDLSADTYGRPYLIKPTQDVVNPLFHSHTIYKSVSHLVKECTAANFIGSFIAGEVPAGENNLFLGPNDLLYFSQDATPIKGTRAYFHVKVPGAANNVSARIVLGSQVVTSINLVNGERIDGSVKTIENGQLVIIRDGKKYNVMGIKLQ